MTTNYRRGADFERTVRDHLMEKHDFAYVVRAAGSHTVADLVALRFDDVWLVQCKRHGRISKEDRELLIDVAREVNATAALASRGPNGRGITLEIITKPEETVGDEGVAD